jgi:hypothetical protein
MMELDIPERAQDTVHPLRKLRDQNAIEQTLNEGFKSDPLNRFESLVGEIFVFLLRHCQSPGKPLEPLLPKHIGNDLLAQRKNCGTVITQADWVIRSQPLTHLMQREVCND